VSHGTSSYMYCATLFLKSSTISVSLHHRCHLWKTLGVHLVSFKTVSQWYDDCLIPFDKKLGLCANSHCSWSACQKFIFSQSHIFIHFQQTPFWDLHTSWMLCSYQTQNFSSYQSTLCNTPEEWRSYLHHSRSLISHMRHYGRQY